MDQPGAPTGETASARSSRSPGATRAVLVAAGVVAVVAAAVGAALVLSLPDQRAGVAPDGISYLGAAANLHAGRGLSGPFVTAVDPFGPAEAVAFDGAVPFVQWPPLYPALLAALGASEPDAGRLVAGWLHVVLFAITAAGIAAITARLSRSAVAGVLTGLAYVAQPDVAIVHVLVASEPLFLVLVLGATWAATRALAGRSSRWFLAACALGSAATLTRYAGAAVVVGAAVAWLVWGAGPLRRRVGLAAAGSFGALAPAAVWSASVTADAGRNVREVAWHPPDAEQWRFVAESLVRWVVPAGDPLWARSVALVLMATLAALAVRSLHGTLARSEFESGEPVESAGLAVDEVRAWVRVCAVTAPVYLAVVLVTHTFFDRAVPIGGRLLVPLLVWVLPLLGAGLVAWVRIAGASPGAGRRWAGWAAVAAVAVLVVPLTGGLVDIARHERTGVAPEDTELTAWLRSLDDDVVVVSNDPALVWFVSGHDAVLVPWRESLTSGRANDQLDAHVDELVTLLDERGGAVVLYRSATFFGPHLLTPDELVARTDLEVLRADDDAVVLGPGEP